MCKGPGRLVARRRSGRGRWLTGSRGLAGSRRLSEAGHSCGEGGCKREGWCCGGKLEVARYVKRDAVTKLISNCCFFEAWCLIPQCMLVVSTAERDIKREKEGEVGHGGNASAI